MSIDSQPDFDQIAAGWYSFRHHTIFKKELTELSARWKTGKLLNAGCGHGADFLPFENTFDLYGIDISSEMLKFGEKFARKHTFKAELKQADMRSIPYPDECFDNAIVVASLHHVKTRSGQLKALAEIRRVLKPGGEAFVTVWNATQPRFFFTRRDTQIPWRQGADTILRYYHLFTYGEIQRLAKSAGFDIIYCRPESRYNFPFKYFSRNICLLLKKPS
ncbi:hypothetical protein DGWBC_1422 [Dehalogenimonas sp. WBC-2]|nr:hypothetical protein DGWBC_1422 [Dehalogenimonas sp. WBC-2]